MFFQFFHTLLNFLAVLLLLKQTLAFVLSFVYIKVSKLNVSIMGGFLRHPLTQEIGRTRHIAVPSSSTHIRIKGVVLTPLRLAVVPKFLRKRIKHMLADLHRQNWHGHWSFIIYIGTTSAQMCLPISSFNGLHFKRNCMYSLNKLLYEMPR